MKVKLILGCNDIQDNNKIFKLLGKIFSYIVDFVLANEKTLLKHTKNISIVVTSDKNYCYNAWVIKLL